MKQANYWHRLLSGQLRRLAWIAVLWISIGILPLIGITEPLVRLALVTTIVVLVLQIVADMWVVAFGEWCKNMGNGLGTLYGAIRAPKQKR